MHKDMFFCCPTKHCCCNLTAMSWQQADWANCGMAGLAVPNRVLSRDGMSADNEAVEDLMHLKDVQ